MFLKASDENLFAQTLRSYMQEFGPDKVIIVFPLSWHKKIDVKRYSPCRVETWDLTAVGLRVENCSANFTMLVD